MSAAEEGFHVWSWQEPSQVPVKLWHSERPCYLDDEGGYREVPVDWIPSVEDNA